MAQIINKLLFTNFEKGRGGHTPELIVIHIIALPGVTAESAYQHFSNPASEVSAHYIIKKDGVIWRCVKDEDTSWAAGSISYKNGAPILPTNPIAKRCFQTKTRINEVAISIENEGSEYEDITPAQYESNVFLIKELSRKFNIPMDSTHICGHNEIKKLKLCTGRISVGKIISMCNEHIAPVAPIAPVLNTANIIVNPPLFSEPQWLQNLRYRTLNKLGFADRTFGALRSPKWNEVRKIYLKSHPACEVCGKKGKLLSPNQIHHKKVFHLHPELELDLNNLICLCSDHHLFFGHLMNFKSWNESVEEDARLWKERIENRP